MKQKTSLFLFLFILFFTFHLAHSKTLKVCTDSNYWFPYSYAEEGNSKGIHIDIAKKALKNVGFTFEFKPLPWKRCLKEAETGQVDAVISASYKPERAKFLHYPVDASSSNRSQWRIMQVEYVVITAKDNKYTFNGDISQLPAPVRAPLAYSIITNLKTEGLEVVTAPDIRQCIDQLIHRGKGSVVTARQNAQHLNTNNIYKGKIRIHSTPITSKSYFMVFSRKTSEINTTEINSIWKEIRTLREDKSYMYELFDLY